MKFTYTPNWLARKQIYYEPDAKAVIEGSKDYPTLNGEVLFYQLHDSVLIIASVGHLPKTENGFFAFHLHDG
ncbi:MAG: hypothetical protein J1E41_06650, partial [Ruminococcus sp.]|nr:hypothetical protein [Ruminococcus sp.]